MTEILIASTEADARALAAVEAHHAEMAGALHTLTDSLLTAAGTGSAVAAEARQHLVEWCERELVPHALAEEQAIYPAARAADGGHFLVDAMIGEHEDIVGLVKTIARTDDLVRAAGAATALGALFDSHLAKENELLLPLLAGMPDVSLAELLDGAHELLGDTGTEAGGCSGHTCGCGAEDAAGHPELDARAIPHAIRHATIFGALEAVRPGTGLVLVAPHDPLPLLSQVELRWPGTFAVEYVERGPETWRLLLLHLEGPR